MTKSKGIQYGLNQKVDDKDKKIMRALFENGRMSVAEIEKKSGVRRDSVARRLKRLQKDEVITGFSPIINPPAIGLPNVASILIKTKTGDDEDKNKFQKKIIGNKFAVHISKIIGKFDYYISIVYKDTGHLNQIVEDVKNYIPNFIEDFEIYQVVEDLKFEDMEELLG